MNIYVECQALHFQPNASFITPTLINTLNLVVVQCLIWMELELGYKFAEQEQREYWRQRDAKWFQKLPHTMAIILML